MENYRFIHYRTILRFTGIVNVILTSLMGIPILWAFWNNDSALHPLIFSAIFSLAIGITLFFAGNGETRELNKRDGYISVIFIWLTSTITSSFPFYFCGATATFGDAVFETIAGFATNGFSLLNFYDISYSVLLWRSILDWVGGIGIIILVISFVPFFKSGQDKVFLYDKSDETIGNIKASTSAVSRRIVLIYLFLTLFLIAALLLQGLGFEDSILLALSTISSSGFTMHNGDVSFMSSGILLTIGLFMIIAGSNFYLIYHAIKLNFRKILRNGELRWYISSMIIPLCVLTIYYVVHFGTENIVNVISYTAFNVVSIISTTGFYILPESYYVNEFWWLIFFFLMFLGSASASSGGGINVFRQAVLLKSTKVYFQKIIHPSAVNKISFNNVSIEEKTVGNVMSFFLIFVLTYIVGFLILTLIGYGFTDSLALAISFLSNTGNAVRLLVADSCLADIGLYEKVAFSAMMVIGRLQIVPLLVVLSPSFWRK